MAKSLQKEDVEIFAVGIGPEIDFLQLNEIVSQPSSVFFAADFARLIKEIASEVSVALRCTGLIKILCKFPIRVNYFFWSFYSLFQYGQRRALLSAQIMRHCIMLAKVPHITSQT